MTEMLNHTWGIVLAGGEGTRVQSFLAQVCGGKGIKQFCAVIGRRSMLQHTVARTERLIPTSRVLVSLNSKHRCEAMEQLSGLPPENLIFQPVNLDTAPGILLPLSHISVRDPDAVVAVFPSDHFIRDEEKFVERVVQAVKELHELPDSLILLGVNPDGPDDGYGWIEPGEKTRSDAAESLDVRAFWEKPPPVHARKLKLKGCLWNTFVFVARARTLWNIVSATERELYQTFWSLRLMLRSIHAPSYLEHCYSKLQAVNFSSAILSRVTSTLRVLPVPNIGWSDWGTEERIVTSLKEIGRLDEIQQRLRAARAAEAKKTARRLQPVAASYSPRVMPSS